MTTRIPEIVRRVSAAAFLDSVRTNTQFRPRADHAAAFHGLAGEFVDMVFPHSESDPFALLLQFLAAFGNAIGRGAYQIAEADRHFTNLFVALVGDTSKARKGSSWGHVHRVLQHVDAAWSTDCIFKGLTTGEGLIHHVRDGHPGRSDAVDAGIADKRAFILAGEFASILAAMERNGNTLSATLREAWDRGDLRTMTKGAPERATGAHVSIVAHITREELLRQLNSTERANGFANRFLWASVRRSKSLPEGGALPEEDVIAFALRLSEALTFAREVGQMTRDEEARKLWREQYDELSEGAPGMFGAVTSRSEAQVLRLSGIYAVLDRATLIRSDHLTSALALWSYCEQSAREIFGSASGDPIADKILAHAGKGPMTMSDVSNLFSGNIRSDRLQAAVTALERSGHIESRQEPTGGRPVTLIYRTK